MRELYALADALESICFQTDCLDDGDREWSFTKEEEKAWHQIQSTVFLDCVTKEVNDLLSSILLAPAF